MFSFPTPTKSIIISKASKMILSEEVKTEDSEERTHLLGKFLCEVIINSGRTKVVQIVSKIQDSAYQEGLEVAELILSLPRSRRTIIRPTLSRIDRTNTLILCRSGRTKTHLIQKWQNLGSTQTA
uniref:Uncharacterized protein n=1 Tax=Cacopsylla melanoneura TaxID=428564 RepID=A0A8D8R674_9HEMI